MITTTRTIIVALCALTLTLPTTTFADIYQWQYINPADPSQGREQSTTLCPDGLGHTALSYAYLESLDLTQAWLHKFNLHNTKFSFSVLNYADFTDTNLTNASFLEATLTNTNFTNAIVVGTCFYNTTSRGFTKEQLYSTASYQSGDLHGIRLDYNDLTAWNFASQNLTDANFVNSTLTNTVFTNAIIAGAIFTDTISRGFTKEQLYLQQATSPTICMVSILATIT